MTYHFYKTLRRRYNIIEVMNASRIYGYTSKYLFFNDTIIIVKLVCVNFRYYKTYNKPNAVISTIIRYWQDVSRACVFVFVSGSYT